MKSVLFLFLFPSVLFAATVSVDYTTEEAGQGFNDTGAVLAVANTPGALTIGEQRKASFEAAISAWGDFLTSGVPIIVQAKMDPITCTPSTAGLGFAGTLGYGQRGGGVWFPIALASKINGVLI